MVVTDLPFASLIAVTQDRMASPSRCTVQAPQAATPQPNLVPVSPRTSRKYQSTGIDGSPSRDCACPYTRRVIMLPSRLSEHRSNARQRLFGSAEPKLFAYERTDRATS